MTELWMMAARGHQPRGIDVVLLELAHELTRSEAAIPFLFNPDDGRLHEAPSDWFDLAKLYDHAAWSRSGTAPRRRNFSRNIGFRRTPPLGRELTPNQSDFVVSFGRPEMIAPLLHKRRRLRHLVMIHDVSMASGQHSNTFRLSRRLKDVTQSICNRADRVFVPSFHTAHALAELNGHSAEVLPLAYDFRRTTPAKIEGLPERFFLHVGPLKFWKNGTRLLNGHKLARAQRPDVADLIVAGRVKPLSQPGVHTVSNPSHEQMQFLYENAHGLVLPSFSEGFALPLGEALSFNKPVIFSDRLEGLRPPSTGYVKTFDPMRAANIADAMLALDEAAQSASLTAPRRWGDVAADLCALTI